MDVLDVIRRAPDADVGALDSVSNELAEGTISLGEFVEALREGYGATFGLRLDICIALGFSPRAGIKFLTGE